MTDADDLIDEQIAYYRARAPWYDDWWNRRGQYERHDEVRARWEVDLTAMLDDFEHWLNEVRPARVLELASGTGEFTRRMVAAGAHVTAVDASPEVHELSAQKLDARTTAVEYVTADLFEWRSPAETTYDAVVFGFWISHVPSGRWDAFWTFVRDVLAPGGRVWFCDNAPPEQGWQKQVLSPPADPRVLEGDGRIDRTTDIHERVLPDGRTFKLVKRFYEPGELERDLGGRRFEAQVYTTEWAFMMGRLTAR